MTFHEVMRIAKQAAMAQSLKLLGDGRGAEEAIQASRRETWSLGMSDGLKALEGETCPDHPMLEPYGLNDLYREAFAEGVSCQEDMATAVA